MYVHIFNMLICFKKQILNEEIFPKLDKLRNQKKEIIEYQKIETELDYLKRLIIAYDFQVNQVYIKIYIHEIWNNFTILSKKKKN